MDEATERLRREIKRSLVLCWHFDNHIFHQAHPIHVFGTTIQCPGVLFHERQGNVTDA